MTSFSAEHIEKKGNDKESKIIATLVKSLKSLKSGNILVEIENKLLFSVEYRIKLFKKKTIERFIDYFKRIIRTVIEIPTKKLSEIEIMSNSEKRRLVKKIREKKNKQFIKEAEMLQYQDKEMTAEFDF